MGIITVSVFVGVGRFSFETFEPIRGGHGRMKAGRSPDRRVPRSGHALRVSGAARGYQSFRVQPRGNTVWLPRGRFVQVGV